MIDRSYLPFPIVQYYQDRGMEKWMDFYLSEHTSAINEAKDTQSIEDGFSQEQIYLLLSQSYSQQLPIIITYREKKVTTKETGLITSLQHDSIILKTDNGHIKISISSILSIHLEITTEVTNESIGI